MLFRNRHQGRDIEPADEAPKPPRRVPAGPRIGRLVAGVEQDHAAVAEIGVEPDDGFVRRRRLAGNHRPVKDRVDRQVVGLDVVNGTAVLDVKPYVSFYDSFNAEIPGWAE